MCEDDMDWKEIFRIYGEAKDRVADGRDGVLDHVVIETVDREIESMRRFLMPRKDMEDAVICWNFFSKPKVKRG